MSNGLVKVTMEQAEAIEKVKAGALMDIPLETLIKAMIVGYEVEQEFVSFEEAMKALKEGKTVCLRRTRIDGNRHFKWEDKITFEEADMKAIRYTALSEHGLFTLIEGKWTIEADTP